MGRTVKVLSTDYMQQFQCIGSDCEDTCCAGWQISIDKNTHQKYKKVRDPEMRSKLEVSLKRNRANPTDQQYSHIILNENKACPLMTVDKMCSVQQKLGESYLSVTCATYPRVVNKIDGVFEKSASMSCPEIARLVLLNTNGIEFDEIEEEYDPNYEMMGGRNLRFPSDIKPLYWEIRKFAIQVVQYRKYSLDDRLIILGTFINALQQLINNKQLEKIAGLIDAYSSMLENNEFGPLVSSITPSVTIQVQLMKELIAEVMEMSELNERTVECYMQFVLGLQYSKELTMEQLEYNYVQAYQKFYAPFMKEHEYMMENYIVNSMFKSMFPKDWNAIFNEYMMIVLYYVLIKMQLIGIAGFRKEHFGKEHVIKLIQAFSREIEHKPAFYDHIAKILNKNDMMSLPYLTILLKN